MEEYDKYLPDNFATMKFSQKSFVDMMLKAMTTIHPDWQLKMVDQETLVYTGPDGDDGTINFHNLWKVLQDDAPENIAGSIRNWLHNWENSQVRIWESSTFVALVRNFGDQLNVESDERATMAGVQLAPELQALFAMDSPSGVMYVPVGDEQLKGSTPDELLKKAVVNLQNVLPPKVEVYKTRPENSWLLRIDNNSESSLILLHDVMSFMEKEANGNLIFCVPTRDVLVCSADVGEAERKYMCDVAKNGWKNGPYSISPFVYSWKNGEIKLVYG